MNATQEEILSDRLFSFISPILLIVGLIGNTLTIIVMQTKAYKNTPSSVVLGSLAVADSAFLIFIQPWKTWLGRDLMDFNDFSCRIYTCIYGFMCQLPANLIVVMTIERLISVFSPLRAKEFCSRQRMKVAVFIVTLTLLILNSPLMILSEFESNSTKCMLTEEYTYLSLIIWPWLDLLAASLLPSVIIITGNALIICKLMRRQVGHNRPPQKHASTTRTLITVSSCFVVLTLPSCLTFVFIFPRLYNAEYTPGFHLITATGDLMLFANSAINFFVYCLSGSKFRVALIRLLSCRGNNKPILTPSIQPNNQGLI
jgi:hypothetical protein